MEYLAFDLGASGGKMFSGVFDGKKLNIEEVYRFDNSAYEEDGKLFWDFDFILKELIAGLKKAVRSGREYSFGIDTFCNDFSLLDKNDAMLCRVRSYRDKRTEKHRDAIYEKTPERALYFKTGNQTALFSTMMQLASMRFEDDGYLLDEADSLVFLPDLLIQRLTGEKHAEYTLVSVSQLFDPVKRDFDEDILKSHGIRRELFPKIVPAGAYAGKILKEKGFSADIDVYHVCEHDTASAFLGAPEKNSIILSSGTWSIIGVETEKPLITEYGFERNFANEGSFTGINRLLHNVMGSWVIQRIKSELEKDGVFMSHGEIAAEAGRADTFKYIVNIDDEAFYSPKNMTETLKEKCLERYGAAPETYGGIFRCVMESLAVKYGIYARELETLTGRTYDRINVIGGGARNSLLCRMTAGATGKVLTAGPFDATALGNIIVQMIATGEISSVEEGREIIKNSCSFEKFMPDDTEKWTEETEAFKRYYAID